METRSEFAVIMILIASLIGLFYVADIEKVAFEISAEYEEAVRPAGLSVTVIEDANCARCYKPNDLINEIKTQNVKIETFLKYDYRSADGRRLILKYGIKKVPAVLIGGEVDKSERLKRKLGEKARFENGLFIFENPSLPYTDIVSGKSVGEIEVILLSANDCNDCYNYEKYVAELKLLGISTMDREMVDYKSEKGRSMVGKYNIEQVPTFILIGDVDAYPALKKIQDYDEGSFALKNAIKPYLDLSSGKVIK